MIVLNTIVADQLLMFKNEVDTAIGAGVDKEKAMFDIIRRYIAESKTIRFEGNGYGEEWVKEAETRGLKNIKTTPEALYAYVSPQTRTLFAKHNILSERELEARYEIKLEAYFKKVQIESRVMGDLVINHVLPVAIRYQNELVQNIKGLKDIQMPESAYEVQWQQIIEISEHISVIRKMTTEMIKVRKQLNTIESHEDKAIRYCNEVVPFFEIIRYHTDKLELLLPDEQWPLPKYRELLFMR
jgi:glutamine synthetase